MYIGEIYKYKDSSKKQVYKITSFEDDCYYFTQEEPLIKGCYSPEKFRLPINDEYEMSVFKSELYSVEGRDKKLERILKDELFYEK